MAQECPRCQLVSPDAATRCDCGYDFVARETKASYLEPVQPEVSRLLRGIYLVAAGSAAVHALAVVSVGPSVGGVLGIGDATVGVLVWIVVELVVLMALWRWIAQLGRNKAQLWLPVLAMLGRDALWLVLQDRAAGPLSLGTLVSMAWPYAFVGLVTALVIRRSNAARIALLVMLFPVGWLLGLGRSTRFYCLQRSNGG